MKKMKWYKKIRTRMSLFRFNGWLVLLFLLVFLCFSYLWWLTSPHYAVYVLKTALEKRDYQEFQSVCDVNSLSILLSKELDIIQQLQGNPIPFIEEVFPQNDSTITDHSLFYERLIHDIVTKNDYFLGNVNGSYQSLMQYLALHNLYTDFKPTNTKLTHTRTSAIAYIPFNDQNNRCVFHIHLVLQKGNHKRWNLKRVANLTTLIQWIQENPIASDDESYTNTQTMIKEMINKPSIFPLFYFNAIRSVETFSSYSFRVTNYVFADDMLDKKEYILVEKNHENDIRFKFVQDDALGFPIEKREAYLSKGTIYYHQSAQEGWITIDEEAASLHLIHTPADCMQDMFAGKEPHQILKMTEKDIEESQVLSQFWNRPESETVIQCIWKEEKPVVWYLFFTPQDRLIGGVYDYWEEDKKKVTTMLFEQVNEEFYFHLDTIVER
jgi:hypothetical protein